MNVLEQPKINFHTFFSLKKNSWFCNALRLNSDKLWLDAAFIWQPRELTCTCTCRLKKWLSLQSTKFNPLQGQPVRFFICAKFLDTKLLEKSNFQTTDSVHTNQSTSNYLPNGNMVNYIPRFLSKVARPSIFVSTPSTFESLRRSKQIYLYCKTIITHVLQMDKTLLWYYFLGDRNKYYVTITSQ